MPSFIKISGSVKGLKLTNNRVFGVENIIDASEGSVSGLVVNGLFAQASGDAFLFRDLIDAEIKNVQLNEVEKMQEALNEMFKNPGKRRQEWLSNALSTLSPDKVVAAWELWEKITRSLGL